MDQENTTPDIFQSAGYRLAMSGKIEPVKLEVRVGKVLVRGLLYCHDAYDMSVSLLEPPHLESSTSCGGHTPYFARGNKALIKVDIEGSLTEEANHRAQKELIELY
ncbi:MAG: hypothetical protein HQM12_18060 [SAR324 cluster bacterium]|nr:hypothetical protein [SAR324 cluster bacterium]